MPGCDPRRKAANGGEVEHLEREGGWQLRAPREELSVSGDAEVHGEHIRRVLAERVSHLAGITKGVAGPARPAQDGRDRVANAALAVHEKDVPRFAHARVPLLPARW